MSLNKELTNGLTDPKDCHGSRQQSHELGAYHVGLHPLVLGTRHIQVRQDRGCTNWHVSSFEDVRLFDFLYRIDLLLPAR